MSENKAVKLISEQTFCGFDDKPIFEYYKQIQNSEKKGIRLLSDKNFYKADDNSSIKSFIGVVGDNHGLKSEIDIGDRYSEPDITKSICHVMGKSAELKNILINTLLECIDSSYKNEQNKHYYFQNINLEAEYTGTENNRVSNDKRIDIYSDYKLGIETHYILVEAKFGHELTEGQLDTYFNFAQKENTNKNSSQSDIKTKTNFIYLTLEGKKTTADDGESYKS